MERMNDMACEGLPGRLRGFFKARGVPDGALILVAYSGGSDSTALLAAAVEAGYRCRALHCNFHLRGDESNRDEAFARSMSDRLGCEIDVVHFDVKARMDSTGESVEMACRELRYDWFSRRYSELAALGAHPACVAIAHHASDNVETFFLNLMRGSGLKGLAAISDSRGIFVRPMLDVAKNDVLSFLHDRNLEYVDDSSNTSDQYRRNVVRNHVLPSLEQNLPGVFSGIRQTIENLRRDNMLFTSLVKQAGSGYVDSAGRIDLASLASAMPCADVMLYHMLGGALAFSEVEKILRASGQSGRWFRGRGGVSYLLDRGWLVRADADESVHKPGMDIEVMSRERFAPDRTGNVLWLDGSVVATSLEDWELRPWKHGDRIRPFGMKGSRLVSDILTDAKMSALAKRNVWVMTYKGELVWVVGVRSSCHFAVMPDSDSVVRIALA